MDSWQVSLYGAPTSSFPSSVERKGTNQRTEAVSVDNARTAVKATLREALDDRLAQVQRAEGSEEFGQACDGLRLGYRIHVVRRGRRACCHNGFESSSP